MTAVVQGPEAVAEAHVAMLQAHLATEMTWVWSAWNDGLPQPTFDASAIVPYDIDGLQYNGAAIGVIPEQWELLEDGTGQGFQVYTYHLRLMAYVVSDNQGALQKTMMRTLQAIQRVYLNNALLDGILAGHSGTTVMSGALFDSFKASTTGLLRQVGGLRVVSRVGWMY